MGKKPEQARWIVVASWECDACDVISTSLTHSFSCRVARSEQCPHSANQKPGLPIQCLQTETQSRTIRPTWYDTTCPITQIWNTNSNNWLSIISYSDVFYFNSVSVKVDIQSVVKLLAVLACSITLHQYTYWTCSHHHHRYPRTTPWTHTVWPQMKGKTNKKLRLGGREWKRNVAAVPLISVQPLAG